ncbi:MAG: hypothetical protein GYA57_02005 [Myxococcales bacterium]|nr:hypothetical protein [Myxococcales bacterium]
MSTALRLAAGGHGADDAAACDDGSDEGGCGRRATRAGGSAGWLWLALGAAAALSWRRRRRQA